MINGKDRETRGNALEELYAEWDLDAGYKAIVRN